MSTWIIKDVLDWAAEDFKSKKMDRPRFEAEVLLAHVLSLSRLDLYTKFDYPLNDTERERFRDAISKRRSGEPVAHITGQKEFWSLEFEVDKNVLIPRPETEILVESAIEVAPKKGRFLDLCTGSGCVAIALAKELPNVSIDAVDISRDACEVAARNAKKHSVDKRVKIFSGDLFEPLQKNHKYSLIVANPPYVCRSEIPTLSTEVQKEPVSALDGGLDGLDIIKRILNSAPHFLVPDGWILLEVDPRQTNVLIDEIGPSLLGVSGSIKKDLAKQDRIVLWQLPAI